MAISVDRILDSVVENVAADGKLPDDDDARAEAIAELKNSLNRYVLGPLIDEIVTNGEISVNVTVTVDGQVDNDFVDWLPADGMQDSILMDPAVSGSGTGTGTGTIT